jgi:chromosome segregation protein
MINKTPVRLMDIRELFMDTGIGSTGYSIVEQGRVGEIVSAKPAERRTLIDDAAGIVKFRTKRQAAERRLEETGQNLLRVNDVLGELQDREEGLREHVENAQTYLDLQSQCRSTEQNLLVVRWHEVGLQEEKLDAKVAEEQQRQQDLQTEKSVVETDLQRLNLEQTQRTDQLTRKREALFQKERDIQEAENQRRLEQQTIENAREQQGRQEQELNELQERLARLEGAVQDASGQFETLTEKREVLETEVAEIERARTEQNDVLQEVTSVLQSLQKRLLKLHMELTNQTNQRNFLEERLTQFQERLQRLQGQRDANAELVRQAEDRAHASRQQLGSLQAKQTTLETRVEA